MGLELTFKWEILQNCPGPYMWTYQTHAGMIPASSLERLKCKKRSLNGYTLDQADRNRSPLLQAFVVLDSKTVSNDENMIPLRCAAAISLDSKIGKLIAPCRNMQAHHTMGEIVLEKKPVAMSEVKLLFRWDTLLA